MVDSQILDIINKMMTSSNNRKRSTNLHQMEFSITLKQSMESDWISASESLLE
jgi:predicted transcriptional regulator